LIYGLGAWRSVGVVRVRRFARGLSDALGLPRTATAIVDLLVRSSRRLSVPEIVERLQMSERSVRGNISLLVRRGILQRHPIVTAKNRLAYLYHLRPREDVLRAVRAQFERNLAALGNAARGKSSPRTAASERS
jgi:predicted DNA-binding transcriptional regulator